MTVKKSREEIDRNGVVTGVGICNMYNKKVAVSKKRENNQEEAGKMLDFYATTQYHIS